MIKEPPLLQTRLPAGCYDTPAEDPRSDTDFTCLRAMSFPPQLLLFPPLFTLRDQPPAPPPMGLAPLLLPAGILEYQPHSSGVHSLGWVFTQRLITSLVQEALLNHMQKSWAASSVCSNPQAQMLRA